MLRGFKYIAIRASDTAQPMVSTTLSAAITASVVANGEMIPASIQVGDSTLFRVGDWVGLGLPSSSTFERQPIIAIADSTHITVATKFAHSSSEVVFLSIAVAMVYIQPKDGNTGDVYIASGETGKVAGTAIVKRLTKVSSGAQPYDYILEQQNAVNSESTGNVWVVGTANDTYLVGILVV